MKSRAESPARSFRRSGAADVEGGRSGPEVHAEAKQTMHSLVFASPHAVSQRQRIDATFGRESQPSAWPRDGALRQNAPHEAMLPRNETHGATHPSQRFVIPVNPDDKNIIGSAQYLKGREYRRRNRPGEYKGWSKKERDEYKENELNEYHEDDKVSAAAKANSEYIAKIDVPERVTTKGILGNLSLEEKIYITGHGAAPEDAEGLPGVALKFGGYEAEALADVLVNEAGLPKGYRGRIYLQGCNTGTGNEASYAKKFQEALARRHARYPWVKANRGWSNTEPSGAVQVHPQNFKVSHPNETNKWKELTAVGQKIRSLRDEKLAKLRSGSQAEAASIGAIDEKIRLEVEKERLLEQQHEELRKINRWSTAQDRKLILAPLQPQDGDGQRNRGGWIAKLSAFFSK